MTLANVENFLLESDPDDPLVEELDRLERDGEFIDLALSSYDEFKKHVLTEWEESGDRAVVAPYPTGDEWAFLQKYHHAYESISLLGVPKSRGMIASTDPLVWSLYECLRVAAYGGIWRTAIVRQSQGDAEELLARILRVYKRLDPRLQLGLIKSNVDNMTFEGGGTIRALNAAGDAGRGEYWDLVLLDEGAFQLYLAENIAAFARAKRKLVVSTPNGTGNTFHSLVSDRSRYPGAGVIRLHYSEHPHRRPGTPVGDAWIEAKKKEMSTVDWRREYEIDFEVFKEKGWFADDWDEAAIQPFEWDRSPVILSFDPGFVRAGATVMYFNKYSQVIVRRTFLGIDETTQSFGARVMDWAVGEFPGMSPSDWLLTGDPAAMQKRSVSGTVTDEVVLKQLAMEILGQGKHHVPYRIDRLLGGNVRDGHREIRMLFKIREDNRLGILIHPDCDVLIEGFRGGYRQIDHATPHDIELEKANRTSDHVHIMDTFRYGLMQFLRRPASNESVGAQKKVRGREPIPILDDETGYVRGYR